MYDILCRSRFDQEDAPELPPAKRVSRFEAATPAAPAAAAAKPALSLDAIQKAKAALQKHKDLAAKLKSMPQVCGHFIAGCPRC